MDPPGEPTDRDLDLCLLPGPVPYFRVPAKKVDSLTGREQRRLNQQIARLSPHQGSVRHLSIQNARPVDGGQRWLINHPLKREQGGTHPAHLAGERKNLLHEALYRGGNVPDVRQDDLVCQNVVSVCPAE